MTDNTGGSGSLESKRSESSNDTSGTSSIIVMSPLGEANLIQFIVTTIPILHAGRRSSFKFQISSMYRKL